jgi:hypothetical protein
MRWWRRLICAHLRWRRSTWEDDAIALQMAARTGRVAWTCLDCGKTCMRAFGDAPVNYIGG